MHTPDYPITTDRLRLRQFEESDIDDFHAYHSLPEVARFLYWEARSREECFRALKRRMAETALNREGQTLALAVERVDTGQLIGELNLAWLSAEHRRGEIGFIFHPDQHGKGYAREAATAALRFGFETVGLRRIIGRCDSRNTSSAKLMERLGMTLEARLRENELFKGVWADELVFGVLADEWAAANPTR